MADQIMELPGTNYIQAVGLVVERLAEPCKLLERAKLK